MKKFGFIMKTAALAVTAAVALAGCQPLQSPSGGAQANKSSYVKIQKRLMGLQTYRSFVTLESNSNKGSDTYEMIQQCKINGEYRVEVTAPASVAGFVTVNDGKSVRQFNQTLQDKLVVFPDTDPAREHVRNEMLITSFIKNYLDSDEVSVSVADFGEGNCTVLEASIPGKPGIPNSNTHFVKEKLWIDNKTLDPVQLIVYDDHDIEQMILTYKTFEYNIELADSVFQ